MIKSLKWEFIKYYRHIKVSLLSCLVILAVLFLITVQTNILTVITDSTGGLIKVLNIAAALIGAYYIFLFPIWNMVNGFQKPFYLLEKTRGIPYHKILLAKIIVNILSVGLGVILLLIEREVLARYASLDINFLIFTSGVEWRTLAATIFLISALFPVLASTIFLFASSFGDTRKIKITSLLAIGLSFIALLKAESWFSGTAELFYIIVFLMLAGSTVYLADRKYE